MTRQSFIVNATVQFDNPIQSAQYGAPVLLTSASIVTNSEGIAMYQPAGTGKYVGVIGLVMLIADAVDIRGTSGAGSGDVTGPVSSTTGHIAVFADGTKLT